jgi:hypothetical protein
MRHFIRQYLPFVFLWAALAACFVTPEVVRYYRWATSKEPSPLLRAAQEAAEEPNGLSFLDMRPRSAEGTVIFDKPNPPTEHIPFVLRILDRSLGEPSEGPTP